MCVQSREDEDMDTLLQNTGFQYYHLLARRFDLYPEYTREGEAITQYNYTVILHLIYHLMLWSQITLPPYDFNDLHNTDEFRNHLSTGDDFCVVINYTDQCL